MKINIQNTIFPAMFCYVLFALFTSCSTQDSTDEEMTALPETEVAEDPLPSWNEGDTKASIIAFVEAATTEGYPGFIPVNERIATFDNDGTLWSEQPVYFQLLFALDRIKELSADHPEWKTTQPFKAVLENDMKTIGESGMHGLMEILMASHGNMSIDEFENVVTQWVDTAQHPVKQQKYTDLVYQPMLELLTYLRENNFKTFIVSGGGIEFMRPWAEKVYGIPRDQVVGSSIKTEYIYEHGEATINRVSEIDFIDDGPGKPVGIWRFIGRRPAFAAGNSDGDLQMLQFATSHSPSFALYIHHTDSTREWAYDRQSSIGKLDKGLDEAREKGWTVVDMQADWKYIYPFEKID